MSTIRSDQVRPLRTITAVENALRTSFWAVADFMRVDPVIASGPVSTQTKVSAHTHSGALGFDDTSAVSSVGGDGPLGG